MSRTEWMYEYKQNKNNGHDTNMLPHAFNRHTGNLEVRLSSGKRTKMIAVNVTAVRHWMRLNFARDLVLFGHTEEAPYVLHVSRDTAEKAFSMPYFQQRYRQDDYFNFPMSYFSGMDGVVRHNYSTPHRVRYAAASLI